MKKLTTIFLTALYLFATAGVMVNTHTCNSKHVEFVSLYTHAGETCCNEQPVKTCCSKPEPLSTASCCFDETLVLKIALDQNTVQQQKIQTPVRYIITEKLEQLLIVSFTEVETPFGQLAQPPPIKKPIWLTNCSLLVYG